jgi:hypothetical protein
MNWVSRGMQRQGRQDLRQARMTILASSSLFAPWQIRRVGLGRRWPRGAFIVFAGPQQACINCPLEKVTPRLTLSDRSNAGFHRS